MGQFRVCMCFTRKFKATEVEPPEDVRKAFEKYAGGASPPSQMTAEQLKRFLTEEQGEEDATVDGARDILKKVLDKCQKSGHTLTLDDFQFYLFSGALNPPDLPFPSKVHHDMTAPLSHYFIYTGHNSYLKGNQLTSKCSDAPIENALKNGVRVIELDLWPNPKKNDVHVLHGRTMTKPVPLIRCLESIKEHAFSASPYPVIITLEDHLKPDLQAKVAKMLKETFGEKLYYPESECLNSFPSPEELKERIIISTKPPKEFLKAETFNDKRKNSQKKKISDDDVWGDEPLDLMADKRYGDSSDYNQDFDDDDDCVRKAESAPKASVFNIGRCCLRLESDNNKGDDSQDFEEEENSPAPHYKNLIAIPSGKPKGGLLKALTAEPDKVRRLSLSEQALESAARPHGKHMLRFTQQNILRVYPKGTRFNSSNYNPLIGWMHGAQMVAFNMQGYGRSLWLMQGMFRANGGCGYVKKPDILMNKDPHDQIMFNRKADLHAKKTLKVKVYMGDGWHLDFKRTHFDCYSPPDFYTRVGIAGVPADMKMEKTKTITDEWTPVWNEEFCFPLTVPELALLRIEVHEQDMTQKDDFGGQTCLPVSELRPGIRAVPLHDRQGKKYNNVRLLIRFELVNAS